MLQRYRDKKILVCGEDSIPLFYILKLRQPVPVRYTPTCGETMSLIILTLYREPDVHTATHSTYILLQPFSLSYII